ncbi:MAG: ubiquitin [Clostridia bacterium]|nr:ubiquitin [Clostridia bacterium]
MEITLEQVEKIREKAGVTYEEAKAALIANHGDLLETLIYLERQGKSPTADQGGFYTTKPGGMDDEDPCALVLIPEQGKRRGKHGSYDKAWTFEFDDIWQAFRDLLRRSVTNQFEVWRADRIITSMPVLILILLAVFFFWCTLPLLLVGLFFGFRYRFRGPDLGKDAVNKVMDGVSSTVSDMKENLKREFHSDKKETK